MAKSAIVVNAMNEVRNAYINGIAAVVTAKGGRINLKVKEVQGGRTESIEYDDDDSTLVVHTFKVVKDQNGKVGLNDTIPLTKLRTSELGRIFGWLYDNEG